MGIRRGVAWGVLWCCACGSGSGSEPQAQPPSTSTSSNAPVPISPASPPPVRPEPPPQAPVFQPAFHQALRWSTSVGTTTTFRMKLPLGRAASRVQVTFRAGDGPLSIARAFIGHAGEGGAFSEAPVPLTFGGSAGARIGSARGTATSDPVPFQSGFHDEVYVSVVLRGEAAASAIDAFPDSFCYPGDQADAASPSGGTPCTVAMAVQTVETEAPPTREFLAIGDSITEEYFDSPGDYRESWPQRLEGALRVPVLDSGVSGQGVDGPLTHFENDVSSVAGVTDCLVLIGTNDLTEYPTSTLEGWLTRLYDALRPSCRVWTATLTPREVENYGDLATAQRALREVNAWLRGRGADPLIDFNAVTRDPDRPDSWKAAYWMDGVHPNPSGAAAMAEEAARVISASE